MSRFFFICLCTSLALAQTPASNKAPDLKFAVPEQGEQRLAQFRGKIVALEFISTACTPCQKGARVLSVLQKEFGDQPFQALVVAVNPNAEISVGDFAKEQALNLPVGWNTREEARLFLGFEPEQNFALPQLVLIDTQGAVRFKTAAMGNDSLRDESVLRQRIQELMRPPETRPTAKRK